MEAIDSDPQIATLRAQLKILEFGSATRRRALEQKWEEFRPQEEEERRNRENAIAADVAGYELIKATEASMMKAIEPWAPRDHESPPRRLQTSQDAEEHKRKIANLRRAEQRRHCVPLLLPKPPEEPPLTLSK
jgi:hypothetical protein